MASSQAQAEITERRLRPLYDAIDNRQNKKALQIADKIIKKQEDLYCAKALKAIVCQRVGRQEEGNSLIDEVVKACPGDQATLQAATMYFRETGDEQKVVDLYTQAAEQYPGNQEILTHLFMAFVRVGNYHKQQQTALQLHKAFPDNGPYYCWRVMSIVMQAHKTNDGSLASTMFLPLAEKLMEKYVAEKKLDVEEEVKLYLMVLEKQGKPEKRLKVIQGPLGNLIRKREERSRLELECHLSLQRWDDAVRLLSAMLRENPDHWRDIETYISCQIQRYKRSVREAKEDYEKKKRERVGRRGGEEGEGRRGCEEGEGIAGKEEVWEGEGEKEEEEAEGLNKVNTREDGNERLIPSTPSPKPLVNARDLLEELRNHQPSPPPRSAQSPPTAHPLRGPFLGRLELVKQVTQNGLQNILNLPSPATLLLDYFAVFGTKSCCFDDLRSYFEFFSPDELKKFMVMAEAKITEIPINFDCSEEDRKRNISILRRQISIMQLQRYCGCHRNLTLDKKRDLVLLCKHLYREGLKLSTAIPESDTKPADFFVVLAVHLMMEIYVETREWSVIWQAVLLLEHSRSLKTTNPQVLLLLLKLYGFLGAAEGITDMFESLNIKHLQMETLGYIPLRYLQSTGAFGFTNQLYRSALRFYYSCAKETSEYIIQAYKNGMFQKILEFVNLRDRLSHSLSFACTLVDMNLLEVVTSIHSMEKAQQFFSRDWFNGLPSSGPALHDYCSSLVDSRDLTVYDDWSRSANTGEASSLTKLENKLSSELEVLWLRVRVMLVQCLKDSVVTMATAPPTTPQEVGGAPEAVAVFSAKVGELSKCLTQMVQHMGTIVVLQHKRTHLLPLQASPPCLGLRFLSLSYGHTLLVMFSVIERLALGYCDVADKLSEVLRLLRTSVSAIHGVPDNLREVVSAAVRGRPREKEEEKDEREGEREEGEGRREGDEEREEEEEEGWEVIKEMEGAEVERSGEGAEVGRSGEEGKGGMEGEEEEEEEKGGEPREGRKEEKNDKVKNETKTDSKADNILNSVPTRRVDMEHYSLFITVASYIVLLSAVCVDIVKPVTGSKKRRKKRQTGSEDGKSESTQKHHQHPSLEDMARYIEDLSRLLREAARPFRPFPSVERQLVNLEEELRRCQLPFDDKNFEMSVYPQTCKLVLQSYNTSMEDSQEVLDSKLAFLDSLLQRLDHHAHALPVPATRETIRRH